VGSWRIIVRAITRCRDVGSWKGSYRAIVLAEGGAENPVGFRRGRGSEECRSERARARSEASPATADAPNSACLSKGAIVSPNNFHTCHDFLRVTRVSVSSVLLAQQIVRLASAAGRRYAQQDMHRQDAGRDVCASRERLSKNSRNDSRESTAFRLNTHSGLFINIFPVRQKCFGFSAGDHARCLLSESEQSRK